MRSGPSRSGAIGVAVGLRPVHPLDEGTMTQRRYAYAPATSIPVSQILHDIGTKGRRLHCACAASRSLSLLGIALVFGTPISRAKSSSVGGLEESACGFMVLEET